MADITRVTQYYPDFRHPDIPAAMFYDPQWVESFIRNCNQDDVAIIGLAWFSGSRDYVNPHGRGNEWGASGGATWWEYREAANGHALEVLRSLPAGTVLVMFLNTDNRQWWHAQKTSRKWTGRINQDAIEAHFDTRGLVMQTRLMHPAAADGPAGARAAPGRLSTWRIIFWIIRIGVFVAILAHQCARQ